MPEGPECRKYALFLGDYIGGDTLESINIVSGRYSKKELPGLEDFKKKLPLQIQGVGVHGKFIYFIFQDKSSLWSTLGMTGAWEKSSSNHTRVSLRFSNGKIAYFNDMRNFGTIKFSFDPKQLAMKLASFGPDMLADDISNEVFLSSLRKKDDLNITKALLDQTVVAGVGNYIKAESLYLARISPFRKVRDLSDANLKILNKSIKSVMRESFQTGGTTINSYKDFYGEIGDNNSRFLVYNQDSDPDGNPVKKEKTPDGRTTHWVPEVQG
ncbi:MAG: hypothetical protein CMB77_04075 [Euryarchaeota archaeon]|nr:hypothetical protein [Euryarchaeota archaeon]|tara:strand:- start:16 stop:822 length:807 start_codon:yes stop_codon:yes gene_type:complete